MTFMRFTKEQQITICTTINNAIAEGHVVTVNGKGIAGAFPRIGEICFIWEDGWQIGSNGQLPSSWLDDRHHTVKLFIQAEGDTGVIYEPPLLVRASRRETASSGLSPS